MSTKKTSVLLLGDSPIMAAGLQQVLDAAASFAVVGFCASEADARDVVRQKPVEVMIMDVHGSVDNRLTLLREIKVDRPHVRVVVMADVLNAAETAEIVMAGADGLLDAAISPDALVAVLNLLDDGVKFVTSHSLWPTMMQALSLHEDRADDHGQNLTRRENDVFDLLRDGLTDREIAEVLTLSLWTVKHHVVNILRKLDMTSRREAVKNRSTVRLRESQHPDE